VEVIGLIVTGGLVGWIGGTLVRGAGYGLLINIVVGVIGGFIGGNFSPGSAWRKTPAG